MKTFILSILLLWLSFPAFSQNLSVTDPVRLLALGDSYTIGQGVPVSERWPEQLADSLQLAGFTVDSVHIVATTGWTTGNLLNAISGAGLEQGNFNLVSLLIGVNNQFQGQSIANYPGEFTQLLDSAIVYAGGDTSRVFVVSIPDYAFTPAGQQFGNPATISSELDQYNIINANIAQNYGVQYFYITDISRDGLAEPQLVAGDNLHPSGEQYRRWVSTMMDTLRAQSSVSGIHVVENGLPAELVIRPNPASDWVTIEGTDLVGAQLEVYDVQGKRVSISGVMQQPNNRLPVNELTPGAYLIVAVKERRVVASGKFLVER